MTAGSQSNGGGLERLARRKRRLTQRKIIRALWSARKLIAENDGLYPHNSGRLSQAELCRLAEVRPSLLRGPAHVKTTLPSMKRKLASLLVGVPKGKRGRRRVMTDRVAQWKQMHQEAADRLIIVDLELLDANTALEAKDAVIVDLQSELAMRDSRIADLEAKLAERGDPTDETVAKLINRLASHLKVDQP